MKMAEEMDNLKDYVRAMFAGKVPFDPPVTFPQSHIIYASSLRHAYDIIKQGGYFVVSKEDIQLFQASTSPEVNFKFATKGKTAAFSELHRGEDGSKTFFAKDYWKLRISLGEDGRTTDWIMMKGAKQCSDMALSRDIVVDKTALAGTMMTSSLPGQNNNYEEEKPTEGWRKEKKKMKETLKKSPAYIRGRLDTPKKKKPKEAQTGGLPKENNGEGVTRETTKVEEMTTEKDKVEEVKKTLEEGLKTKKHSNYFEFVKRVLEQKSKRKAERKVNNYEEEDAMAAQTFTPKVEPHIQSDIFSIHNLDNFTSSLYLTKKHNHNSYYSPNRFV